MFDSLKVFARVRRYFPRYRRELGLGYLCLLPSALPDLAGLWLIQYGIDQAIAGGLDTERVLLIMAGILGLNAVYGVLRYGMRWYLVGTSRALEKDLRRDVYEHLLRLPPSFYGRHASGDLVARMTADVEAVRMTVGPGLMYVANTVVTVPIALAMMIQTDPMLTLWILGPMVLIAVLFAKLSPAMQQASERTQKAIGDLSADAAESFSGIRILKVFTREDAHRQRMADFSGGYLDAQMDMARARGRLNSWLYVAKDLGLLAILAAGSVRVMQGHLSLGAFFLFNALLLRCFWPMMALGWMTSMLHRGAAAMRRIEGILTTPVEIADPAAESSRVTADAIANDGDASVTAPAHSMPEISVTPTSESASTEFAAGDVEWDDVTVQLGPVKALDRVSIRLPRGTSLGITGRTGSGKSTLAALVPRLLDPESGTVRIGGQDVREWPLSQLRRTVGMVPQDAFLFSDSLRDNLRFARPDATDEAILEAAHKAALDTDLAQLDAGLETEVGERGVTLSGGQRQRSTIVRTLVENPPVLVLDDCLSAVDAETETRILERLRHSLRGRTTLVISHRIAALRHLDRVLVLEHGRVVEDGTHDELIAAGGLYAELDQLQRLEQELEDL